MPEVIARVEDRLSVASLPGRRAHAVEDEGELVFQLGWIETVPGGVDPDMRDVPPRELGEERLEPVRMLVVNGDGSGLN